MAEKTAKLDEQIAIAKEKEAAKEADALQQRLALERQKDAEVTQLKNEFFEQEVATIAQQEKAKTATEIAEVKKRVEQRAKVINDSLASNRKRAEELANSFSQAGNVIGSTIDALGEKAAESTVLGKGLALTQIGISSAEAIAKGTAAAAGVPFPGNLVAIGTTVAAVLSQIAAARKLLQKKDGGWHSVVGADDNRTYRAKYIGSQPSGMLPSHPVVLASEAGPEYFVSNRDLQNPHVVNHVRAIENIVHHRMPQYMEGGFTPSTTNTTQQQSIDFSRVEELLERQVVATENLQSIKAEITDKVIVDIVQRFNTINNASGGVLN